MDFSEKINYLFELSHAEGRELAAEMSITAPQISKMRNGVRGLPKNKEAAWMIANFFAKRCTNDIQRESLAEKIKLAQVKNVLKEKELTDILLDWLSDEKEPNDYAARRADAFLRRFSGSADVGDMNSERRGTPKTFDSDMGRFFTFYGNEGKRKAVLTFLQYTYQRKVPLRINILTDEKTDWIMEEPSFPRELQKCMEDLVEMGCIFRRIAGPISDMDQAFESLNRWFPLYITGKATSYYYNRMRDNLNHLTMFIVPDVAVLFSFSVGMFPQKNGVTFFTTDTDTVSSLMIEYENYLNQCEPIMKTYSREDSTTVLNQSLLAFEEYKGNSIRRCNSLSFITMPWETAMALKTEMEDEKAAFLSCFASRYKAFKKNVEKYSFTDIIRLANIEDIMGERVPIPVASVLGRRTQYYTVMGYFNHLNSILYMLKQYKNYHVVIRKEPYSDPSIVYVKEGQYTILIQEKDPFAFFEVSEHYLVDAFSESLHRLIPVGISEAEYRKEVVAEIKGLIYEIEQRMVQERKGK